MNDGREAPMRPQDGYELGTHGRPVLLCDWEGLDWVGMSTV